MWLDVLIVDANVSLFLNLIIATFSFSDDLLLAFNMYKLFLDSDVCVWFYWFKGVLKKKNRMRVKI